MARIADLLAAGPTYSMEFGPPRTDDAERRLAKTLVAVEPLEPSFVSVTYGALGSTREKTHEIVDHINRQTPMTVMPHLTCVAHTREMLVEIVGQYRDEGIENLLALGGDPPVGGEPIATDFIYASELTDLVRELGDFSIGVAAFPEGHPRSPDLETDRKHLAAKLRQADFAITQFFFDADDYFRMVEDVSALGVDKPIIPGLINVISTEGLRRMASINHAAIPDWINDRLDRASSFADLESLAIDINTDLGRRLLDGGAPGLHLCTLGYAKSTKAIWRNLGLQPGKRADSPPTS